MTVLPTLAALPFLGALALAFVPETRRRLAAVIAGAVAVGGVGILAFLAPMVMAGEVLRWSVPWLPELGLAMGFRVDGLAWLFAGLICGIGALVVLYAAWYLADEDPPARFFLYLMLFMGAMLGIVLSDNLVLLLVFWELTSLSSFLLIGYWSHRSDAREGARMALAITGGGGLALLGGVLLLGHIAGGYDLDTVLAAGDTIRAHPLYLPALVLVLLGAFTKSAQFPFHFWLPHAMAAPTPVSAYLHSATMVKAGIFLMARLYPALGGTEWWFWLVTLTGLATLLVGAYVAVFKHDLKGLLAYSTISHLGLITMLLGLDEPTAVVAAIFHILNHATFKASLFMAAGIIDHETGTRDIRRLGGLWKAMPRTATLAIVASAAMAGVPLLNGFLSKEMFFTVTVDTAAGAWTSVLLPLGATVAGILSVAYSLRFVHDVFFHRAPASYPNPPHEPPAPMRIPVELLVVLCVAVGVAPTFVIGDILATGARAAIHGGPGGELPAYSLALWHGFNLPLLMSVVALAGGVALYFGLQRIFDLRSTLHLPRGGRDLFVWGFARALGAARDLTATLQNGRLQGYLTLLVLMALAAGAVGVLGARPASTPGGPAANPLADLSFGAAMIAAIGIAAAVATAVFHRRRLLALVLLGATGLVVSLAFVHLSAPDLALTQVLVEVVTIVLMMLALRWLPLEGPAPGAQRDGLARRWRDGVIAGLAGLGVAALTWAVLAQPLEGSISPFFLAKALPEGGGSNVVNVILVDFRGFDTLGEITVLGIAGLTIYMLLAGFRPPAGLAPEPPPGPESERHPLLLALISRLLLPLAVLVSIYLFLRGHNEPGGGFIAGLVLAIALVLQYVASGAGWVHARAASDYRPWVGWGLLVAGLTGVGSWFVSAPFLTSTYDYPVWPVVGDVPLASAAVFDLGVYLTVVGATMLALVGIARLSGAVAARPERVGGAR